MLLEFGFWRRFRGKRCGGFLFGKRNIRFSPFLGWNDDVPISYGL
jgi:hypothetical protein